MFGRQRIRRLQSEIKVLREAVDWYAVNDNWKRRGIHPKGTPVRFEMSPAQKDHGGRARAAQVQADRIRRGAIGRILDAFRGRFYAQLDERAAQKSIAHAADHLQRRVTVPAPLAVNDASDGETNVLLP